VDVGHPSGAVTSTSLDECPTPGTFGVPAAAARKGWPPTSGAHGLSLTAGGNAAASGPVVGTSTSFSVAAWINLAQLFRGGAQGHQDHGRPEGRRQPPGRYGYLDAEAILATTPGVNGLYGVTPATVPRRLRPWSQRPGQLRCTSSPTTLPPRHLQVVLVGVPPVAAEGTEMLVRPGSGWLCVLGAVQAQAPGERARPWCVASSSSAGPVVGWSLCPCGRSAA
jgi:hypothetical protein